MATLISYEGNSSVTYSGGTLPQSISGTGENGIAAAAGDTVYAEWGPKTGTGTYYALASPTPMYKRRNLTIGMVLNSTTDMFFGTKTKAERNSIYNNASSGVTREKGLGVFIYDSKFSYAVGASDNVCWSGTPGTTAAGQIANGSMLDNKTAGSFTDTCKHVADSTWTAGGTDFCYGQSPSDNGNPLNSCKRETMSNNYTVFMGFKSQQNTANYVNDIPWCGMMQAGWNWTCSPGFPYKHHGRKWCYKTSGV